MLKKDDGPLTIWTSIRGLGADLIAFLKDESGLTTIEYTTMGGVLSGFIVAGASALRDAQAAALDRMVQPD